jgi:hypothetical protein
MAININFQILPFGQIVFKMDSVVYEALRPLPDVVREKIEYHEPRQTVPVVYELIYEPQRSDFIVPTSTT